MAHRRRIQQEQEPGLHRAESKANKKIKRKEDVKQPALSGWGLERDLPSGTVRAWMDGSEQKGTDGNSCAGYGFWIGPRHQLNCAEKLPDLRQTHDRAAMTAVSHALKIVPPWVPLQICTDSQLMLARDSAVLADRQAGSPQASMVRTPHGSEGEPGDVLRQIH